MANRNDWCIPTWLTTLFAVACFGLAAPALSWSQPTAPAVPFGDIPPAALPVIAAPVPSRPLIARRPCDADYSIVSTRCCKNQVECCQPCQYRVYRYDGPGGGQASSLDELYALLQPGVPVCFMAHGSFVEWDSMLRDCAGTYRWLRQAAPDQPIHIVFFTWPADDSVRLIRTLDVNHLGRRAELNSLYLAELISCVPAGHPISLIGHSHGARLVSATVHALAGGVVEGRCFSGGPDRSHRIRVVLAAAAIDHDWFNPGGRFDLALCRAEAVLNLRNRHDFPLLFYPTRRPFSRGALAITGVTHGDRRQLGDRNCRIDDCDITHLVGLGHYWSHYYCQPDIACAIRHFVYFDE